MPCPGCGRDVEVLPGRPPAGSRPARAPRRKQHAVTGSLGGGYLGRRAAPAVRCTHPLTLTADEATDVLEDACS